VALRGHPFLTIVSLPEGVATEGHPYNDVKEDPLDAAMRTYKIRNGVPLQSNGTPDGNLQ